MALETEYQALRAGPALVDRSYRALLEVEGADRATWLHNLTTNQVNNLGRGEGNYAFVLNVQGRILFDLNVLIRTDSIWLDLDRLFLDTAKQHFSKYAITEDVTVIDRTAEFARFGLVGRQTSSLLADLGAPNAAAMAQLSQTVITYPTRDRQAIDQSRDREHQTRDRQGAVLETVGLTVPLIRHDFCGSFAVELFVPADHATEFRSALIDHYRAIPVGNEAVQIHRIEAGIPWPGHEITDEVLPAETRLLERAVNYQKGCYLGQEVVERMRSRAVVARQLVGLRFMEGTEKQSHEATKGNDQSTIDNRQSTVDFVGCQVLDPDGKPVGQLTSACRSLATDSVIGLGYIRTASSAAGTALSLAWDGGDAEAVVVELPFNPQT